MTLKKSNLPVVCLEGGGGVDLEALDVRQHTVNEPDLTPPLLAE